MDIYPGKNGEECIFRTIADTHLMKTIVIQYTVIDPLRTGSVLVDLFPFIRSVKKRSAVAGIIAIIDIDDSPVSRRTALILEIAMINLSHGKRTSEFVPAALRIIAIVDHFKAGITERNTIL
jgi:hypothetical protein